MCAGVGGRPRKVPESSGVAGVGQVPEAGSGNPESSGAVGSGGRFGRFRKVGRFGRVRRVPPCAGVGSKNRFRKVRFRRQVPEGTGELKCMLGRVPEAGSGRASSGTFRRVPEVPAHGGVCSGSKFRKESSGACYSIGSGGKFQKVRESSGVCWCRFRKQVPEGSGGFR